MYFDFHTMIKECTHQKDSDTFGNLSVLTESSTQRQSDVREITGRVRQALSATVGRSTAHRLRGLRA